MSSFNIFCRIYARDLVAGVESDFLAERHDIYQRLKNNWEGEGKEKRGKRKERKETVGNPPTFNSLSLSLSLFYSPVGRGSLSIAPLGVDSTEVHTQYTVGYFKQVNLDSFISNSWLINVFY